MIRAETTPPIGSKMLASHSWSMFHERLPTKMLTEPVDSGLERLLGVSVAEVGASLRFWPAAGLASSSSSSSSSEDSSSSSESSSEDSSDDSPFLDLAASLVPLALAAFFGAASSEDSSSESSSESSSDSSDSSSDQLSS